MSVYFESTPESDEAVKAAARATFTFLLLRGLLALGFGIAALFWPGPTGKGLIYAFAIFCIIDGIIGLLAGFILRGQKWGWIVFGGVMGIVIGLVAFRWPGAIGLTLLLLIAAWALVIGAFQVAGSFTLKSMGDRGWYWTLVAGVIALALGLLLLFNPITGAKAIVVTIGIFAALYGIIQVIGAFSVRKLVNEAIAG